MKNTKTISERNYKANSGNTEPVDAYYEAIKLACEAEDQAYVDLFKRMIKREKAKVNRAELQRSQYEHKD